MSSCLVPRVAKTQKPCGPPAMHQGKIREFRTLRTHVSPPPPEQITYVVTDSTSCETGAFHACQSTLAGYAFQKTEAQSRELSMSTSRELPRPQIVKLDGSTLGYRATLKSSWSTRSPSEIRRAITRICDPAEQFRVFESESPSSLTCPYAPKCSSHVGYYPAKETKSIILSSDK